MAKLARPSVRLRVTLALAAIAVAVAGCATAPSGGPPRSAPGGNSQVQAYVQPLPPPGPTNSPIWTPQNVVLGFLHASASYAFDPAAARQYLVPELRRSWHPRHGVAVVGAPSVSKVSNSIPKLNLASGESAQVEVHLTGQQLATVSQSGQYQYAPGPVNIHFLLTKNTNGVWLIQQLPPQQTLMLTESDFEEVYQPRNLFFFAPAPSSEIPSVLVPDPVYAPQQSANSSLNTDLATGLVNGLLRGPGGWLAGATTSAFPPGTRLLKKVTITGKTAQVDLGGAAATHAPGQRVGLMADQLAETLGDGSYALPLANLVQLSINGRVQDTVAAADLVPAVPSGPVELITGTSSVGELPGQPVHGDHVQPRLSQDQLGPAKVTAVAASPISDHPPQLAVAVQNPAGGCVVEEQPGGQGTYKNYPLAGSDSQCASLSYDANGNLWAAAGSAVWVLPPGRSPLPVDLSAMSPSIQLGDQILALQMAPDGVRAALLITTPAGGNQLLLTAARVRSGSAALGQPVTVGAGLPANPLAISWYNAYDLAVLAPSGTTSGIYEVPLTTGAAQQPTPQLGTPLPTGVQPMTLTTDGKELVVGATQGASQVVYAEEASSPGSWSSVANGWNPVYPG